MSFADSFWTCDYETGLKTLFDQLRFGVSENEDFIQLFTKRMELEIVYGNELESIQRASLKSSSKRQSNDDYVSSIKNLYQKINENFQKQGEYHLQNAENIRQLVLEPFSRWCKEHDQRVSYSKSVVFDKVRAFKTSKHNVEKLQKRYFNRCRLLEEFKTHYSEEEINEELKDIEFADHVNGEDGAEEDEVYVLGEHTYNSRQIKDLLVRVLTNINLGSHKVPILGTYHSVCSGSDITQWVIDNMTDLKGNIAKAESIGQDLLNNGFIRLIGSMSGKNFINSSQYFYQWKPLVFEITKLSEYELNKSKGDGDLSRAPSNVTKGSNLSDYFEDVKQAIGVTNIDYNDRSQLSKLVSEVNNLDEQYYQSTVALDKIRCELEEIIMDHLTFMQKCELDRLKAVKKVSYDFTTCFAKDGEFAKKSYEELEVLEETINPKNDLIFLIENYATGKFKPQVILYDNYYNSNVKQTFGVDLTVKSRLDRKVVPVLIQAILSHLDNVYPDLANDEERINLWTLPVHLTQVHQLRFQLNDNNDHDNIIRILEKTHPMIITNLLKLYFMELPDSIIPHEYYDLIKSLYQNYPANSDKKSINESRVNGLQNILVDLPKCNLATLDAILTHLTRLIHIIGSKDKQVATNLKHKISREFSNLILRPKPESQQDDLSGTSASGVSDKHQVNLLNDLFDHKDAIFKELRRRNSSRLNNVTRESSIDSQKAKSPPVDRSKTRLESKLQHAVHAGMKKTLKGGNEPKSAQASTESLPSKSETHLNDSLDVKTPVSTSKPALGALKRSNSPKKKRLSEHLYEANESQKTSVEDDENKQKDQKMGKGWNSPTRSGPVLQELSNSKNVDSLPETPSKSKPKKKQGKKDVIVLD